MDRIGFRVEARANVGEGGDDLSGFGDAESRERFVETEVGRWHDRDVDYTEGHPPRRVPLRQKLRPPQKAAATVACATILRYARFALAGGGAAAFAVATSDAKAAASFTAMSARTLRSRETPAAFKPWINWP
jgi:hypothetical protein